MHCLLALVGVLANKKCAACVRACQNPDGSEDLKKGTQLLEVYALEIQMYTEQKNTKRLKQLYHKALYVKSAIPHPRIMGIIRECGGKMHMHERIWSEAATDFFEVDQWLQHLLITLQQPSALQLNIICAFRALNGKHAACEGFLNTKHRVRLCL